MGRLNTVKVPVLPNLTYRVNAVPTRKPGSYFVGIDKPILESMWRGNQRRIASPILKV